MTGAAGFIGRHCCRYMADSGYSVFGMDRFTFPEAAHYGIEHWLQCDILRDDLRKCETPEMDGIIHCAGSASVQYSFEEPAGDFAANVATTAKMLEFAQLTGCRAFVLVSSAAVYGYTGAGAIGEERSPSPVSPYGYHKRMAELLCASYGANFRVPSICVRLFSVCGPGLRKQLFWDACVKAAQGEFSFYGTGRELRDWLHVEDAARLLGMAIDHASPACPVTNGGSGTGVSVRTALEILGRNWNGSMTPAFSGEERRGDPSSFVADASRVKEWGFLPSIPLDAALCDYVEWFKTAGIP